MMLLGRSTELGKGQFQEGPLHKFQEEIRSRNRREERSEKESGTNFRTGNFAPPKPEFGAEFW